MVVGTADTQTYSIPCLLDPVLQAYQREMVDLVASRCGLTFTQQQAIPAHFTLKYHFTTQHIVQVEALVADFARRHAAAPVTAGGFGHFEEDVLFVEVRLSDAARRVLEAFIAALRMLAWMSWSPHDAEHLHPHMTIAERCRSRFREAWDLVQPHERHFTGAFDNITILRKVGESNGMDRWAVHASFALGT